MNKTKIPWCQYTWNPITGCTPCSDGCKNCYAHAIANRFNKGDFSVKFHINRLVQPIGLKTPSVIFCGSTTDLWHPDVQRFCREMIWTRMRETPQHIYLVLTKRPELIQEKELPPNCWLGVTIESNKYLSRFNYAKRVKAAGHFISYEPLLEHVQINPNADWIIVGGEQCTGARPCYAHDIIHISSAANAFNIPYFFKQFGTNYDGGEISSYHKRKRYPEAIRKIMEAQDETNIAHYD